LGHKSGTQFYKKFLLKKTHTTHQNGGAFFGQNSIPIDFDRESNYEQVENFETWLKISDRSVKECTVEKRGANRCFTYTHKRTIKNGNEVQLKKKCISAAEYIQISDNLDPTRDQLASKRVCIIEDGIYMVFDFYEKIDGQPLTCIIQIDEAVQQANQKRINLPKWINIYKDITDIPEYQPSTFALKDYKMEEVDKKGTEIAQVKSVSVEKE
jgi:hypothetical protein